MRILLVDDEPIVLEGLSNIIQRFEGDWQIVGALTSGEEALKALPRLRPDLIITDIRMYELSGLELAAQVRQHYPDMLVVLLTGHADFSFAQQAVAIGAFEYLLKPSRYEDILSCLRRARHLLATRVHLKAEHERLVQREQSSLPQLRDKLLQDLALGIIRLDTDLDPEFKRLGLWNQCFGAVHLTVLTRDSAVTTPEQESAFLRELSQVFSAPVLHEGVLAATLLLISEDREEWDKAQILGLLGKMKETGALSEDSRLVAGCGPITKDPGELFASRHGAIAAAAWARNSGQDLVVYSADLCEDRPQASPPIQEAMRYIDEHFHSSLTLDEISRSVYLNPCYLSARFRTDTGRTITEYVQQKRVLEAKRLLSTTDDMLQDIALKVGIPDPSYFSAVFKKHTGMTPTRFREQGEA